MGRVSALSDRAVKFDGPLLNGRWKLGARLGKGGQGQTYIARNDSIPADRSARVVVVKKLVLGDEGWKKFDLFEREVAVLKALSHPGIPRFLDHFEGKKGTFYLVMERAPGRDLSRVVAGDERLEPSELRDVLVRVLGILEYLHRQSPPIIHRDIKPANLVRARGGGVMLVDFGGVRAAVREDGARGSTMIGTFGYMAPEQLHGEATPATDIFGLGATIVALACGTEPENVPRKGLRMDLKVALRHLPGGWQQVLGAMTDPDPDTRPSSATEVLKLIRDALPAGDETSKKRGKKRKRRAADQRRGGTSEHTAGTELVEVMPLELDVPAPVDKLLRVLLWLVGGAGYIGLSVVRALILPIAFTVTSAFMGSEGRAGLKKSRDETYGFVDRGRRGFRGLQLAARHTPPQLGDGSSSRGDDGDGA